MNYQSDRLSVTLNFDILQYFFFVVFTIVFFLGLPDASVSDNIGP